MSTKDLRIATTDVNAACDVCGRTLLRGERAHSYLEGDTHRSVCELCTDRANQEGWVLEGTVPAYDGRVQGLDRRRSLLGRLRRHREAGPPVPPAPAPAEETNGQSRAPSPKRPRARLREPRHVRAIPTSPEHRMASAIEAFNGSEHPRTVAGVARSLGLPSVSVAPLADRPSVVGVVVAWELCWYRYEVDLADEDSGVPLASQGSELHELTAEEREPNAVCDERGSLALPG